MENHEKISLADIQGLISSEKVEGRFQEIISTQKIVDTKTGQEYDGLVETDFLKLINDIHDRWQKRREEVMELRAVNDLLYFVIDGYKAEKKLISLGLIDDE